MATGSDNAMALTALARQWGVRVGMRVWVGGHDLRAKRLVHEHLPRVSFPPVGLIDLAFVTPKKPDEWAYFVRKLWPRLAPDGSFRLLHHTGAGAHEWMGFDAALHAAAQTLNVVAGRIVVVAFEYVSVECTPVQRSQV